MQLLSYFFWDLGWRNNFMAILQAHY